MVLLKDKAGVWTLVKKEEDVYQIVDPESKTIYSQDIQQVEIDEVAKDKNIIEKESKIQEEMAEVDISLNDELAKEIQEEMAEVKQMIQEQEQMMIHDEDIQMMEQKDQLMEDDILSLNKEGKIVATDKPFYIYDGDKVQTQEYWTATPTSVHGTYNVQTKSDKTHRLLTAKPRKVHVFLGRYIDVNTLSENDKARLQDVYKVAKTKDDTDNVVDRITRSSAKKK